MRLPAVVVAVGTGVAAGLVARGSFSALPAPWDTLANTSALWGLAGTTAVLLTRERRTGPAAGLGALCLLVMAAVFAATSTDVTVREVALWALVGTVAGAAFGAATARVPDWRAVGAMGGVIVGEAVYGIALIGGPQWWLELAVGVALCGVARRRAKALGLAAGLAVALFAAYLLYDAVAAA